MWIGLALYGFLKPGLSVPRRWTLFFIVSAFCVFLIGNVIRDYRRAVHVFFTSEGLWTPSLGDGRFLSWAQVTGAAVRNARDLELRHPGGRYRIYATGFADPYAISDFVRSRVGGSAGAALPVSGPI
ncbi:MAG TPA: hypothetical protein VIA45_06810 [Thermoanaerobaculia bacterium]